MLFCLYEYICIYIPTLVSEHANFCLLAPNSNPIVFSPQKTKPPSWVACFLAGAIGFASLEPPDKQFTELFTLREICRANFLPIRILLFFPTKKINTPFWACHFFGRGNRIRTYDHGVRVRGLTAWRYPYFLYFIKLL